MQQGVFFEVVFTCQRGVEFGAESFEIRGARYGDGAHPFGVEFEGIAAVFAFGAYRGGEQGGIGQIRFAFLRFRGENELSFHGHGVVAFARGDVVVPAVKDVSFAYGIRHRAFRDGVVEFGCQRVAVSAEGQGVVGQLAVHLGVESERGQHVVFAREFLRCGAVRVRPFGEGDFRHDAFGVDRDVVPIDKPVAFDVGGHDGNVAHRLFAAVLRDESRIDLRILGSLERDGAGVGPLSVGRVAAVGVVRAVCGRDESVRVRRCGPRCGYGDVVSHRGGDVAVFSGVGEDEFVVVLVHPAREGVAGAQGNESVAVCECGIFHRAAVRDLDVELRAEILSAAGVEVHRVRGGGGSVAARRAAVVAGVAGVIVACGERKHEQSGKEKQ